MAEKGYRIKRGDKWIEIKRVCGEKMFKEYDYVPNSWQMSLKIAEKMYNLIPADIKSEFEIVESGILTDEEKELNIYNFLTRRKFPE